MGGRIDMLVEQALSLRRRRKKKMEEEEEKEKEEENFMALHKL